MPRPVTRQKRSLYAGNANVWVRPIRYYEQMGLIDAPERSEGNQLRYPKNRLGHLSFIRHSRDLGANVEDIRGLLDFESASREPEPRRTWHCHSASQRSADQNYKTEKVKA
jgi:DNA-binding transcriptional MerR regulator